MAFGLVVTSAFGSYQKGQHITDAKAIEEIEASPESRHTVRAVLPDPAPTPAKAKAQKETA